MKPALPLIPGVRPLSRNEIKKDISDIDCSALSDTESTTSVLSEDVLPSTYPVKPRKYPKAKLAEAQRNKQFALRESEADQNSIEETIEFLRVIETAKPEIYEAEKEREELEIKYQALRELCNSNEDGLRKRRFTLENYLRMLQSSTRSLFNLYDNMSLHNSLLYDLLISLKSHRKTFGQLGLQLKEHTTTSTSSTTDIDERSNTSPIYFYISQVIQTPEGLGTVVSLDKQKQSLSIYFPDSIPPVKEYSCLTLYNYFQEHKLVNMDAYHHQNLERKWRSQSLLNELPLDIVTPFQLNLQHIHNLTEEDIYSLVQPSQPNQEPTPSTTAKKTKRSSKSNSIEDTQAIIPNGSTISLLSSPLSIPLMATKEFNQTTTSSSASSHVQPSLLYLKAGTLPYVVENIHSTDDSHLRNHDVDSKLPLFLELSSQAYSSSTYTHHALPNPYDDSFLELIGLDPSSYSKYQTINPSMEKEISKLHELLKPLMSKIRERREETKFAALQVERSKIGYIRQYHEMGSLRLGLFTRQLLMKSQLNGSAPAFDATNGNANQSLDLKNNNTKETTTTNNSKSGNSSSKKKTKQATPSLVQPVPPPISSSSTTPTNTVESVGSSQRPKRKKDDPQAEPNLPDNDDEEATPSVMATGTTTSNSSKSKKQRR